MAVECHCGEMKLLLILMTTHGANYGFCMLSFSLSQGSKSFAQKANRRANDVEEREREKEI
jgi:hypothetical protein